MVKGWNQALEMCKKNEENWALYAKSFLDRTRLALASKAEAYHHLLQPSAGYLGSLLGVDQWAVSFFMHLPSFPILFFFFLLYTLL
jgi:alpha-glucan, water dikinase